MRRRLSTETELWCSACRVMHNRSEFGKDKNTADGFARVCKAVVKDRNRQCHAANRVRNNERHRALRASRKAGSDNVIWAMKRLVRDAARRARRKGLEFALCADSLATPTTCPLLGITLIYQADDKRVAASASIDRIDSNRGYVPDNCWVISWRANQIKSDATLEELQKIAQALAYRLGKKAAGRTLDRRTWDEFPEAAG